MKLVARSGFFSALLLATAVFAQEHSSPGEALRNVNAAIADAQFFSLDITATKEIAFGDFESAEEQRQHMVYDAPNKLLIHSTEREQGEERFTLIACDGTSLHIQVPGGYVEKDAPMTRDGILEDADVAAAMEMVSPKWLAFTLRGSVKEMIEAAQTMKHLGIVRVDDMECHHFELNIQGGVVIGLWIQATTPGLVRRVLVDLKQPAQQGRPAVNMVEQVDFLYNLTSKPEAADFAFTPPEGSKQVNSIAQFLETELERWFQEQTEGQLAELYKGEPIPAAEDAYTHVQFEQMAEGFYVRLLRQSYEDAGNRNEAWDAPMLELADAVAKMNVNRWPRDLDFNFEPVLKLVEECRAANCSDPLLLHLHAFILYEQDKIQDAERIQVEAFQQMQNSNYPDLLQFYVVQYLFACRTKLREKPNEEELSRWKEYLPKALFSKDLKPGEIRLVAANVLASLRELEPEEQKQIIDALMVAGPDTWAANWLLGEWHVDEAWRHRGGGWASTVTEEGWQGFGEHLEIGYKYLKKAWEINPEYPEAATRLIAVAMGGYAGEDEGEGIRYWFDQAVKAQLDYMHAYSNYRWAIYPRWGGSHTAMLNFAKECLATQRYDTLVPWFYLDTVTSIDRDGGKRLIEQPEVATALNTIADNYERMGQTRKLQHYARVYATALAYRAGRYDEARAGLENLKNEEIARDGFQHLGVDYLTCRREVYTFTSPQAQAMKKAVELAAAGKHEEALEMLSAIAKETDQADIKAYAEDIEYWCKIEKELAAGYWVTLPFKPGLPGWTVLHGDWEVKGEDALYGTASDDSPVILLDARPGLEYELIADMAIAKRGCKEGYTIAVVVDHNGSSWRSVVLHRGFDECRIYSRFDEEDMIAKPFALQHVNTLRLVRRNNMLEVYVNGESVYQDIQLNGRNPMNLRVGFASRHHCRTNTVAFHNIRLRRLDVKPPETW